ncbi:hypothetical protein TNCT_299381 [Trichonephila clavata]|uniref:Uncharacterized protein n=1 Tax=Trichonephila clavata TaxID=2740835 RepID=A0A8X6LCQ6_TRICU|nr:hypothetical protein TNCT_299381 [Trichonephila clavata]
MDSILRAACGTIPRGNRKKYKLSFIHNSEALLTFLHQRNTLQSDCMSSPSPDAALNLINANIKQLYSVIRRERWNIYIACVKDLTHELLKKTLELGKEHR